MPSYLVIGHVTRDVTPHGRQPGGTVSFASHVVAALGYETRVVTAAADALDDEFSHADVVVTASPYTTTLEHIWTVQGRQQRLLHRACVLHGWDVPEAWRSSDIWHLGPVANEIAIDILDVIPTNVFVGVTPQGWMRAFGKGGEMMYTPWLEAERVLARANAVVLSEEDLPDTYATARAWAENGRVVAVTQGPRGSVLLLDGGEYHIPAFQVPVCDENGAGDRYAAALFARLACGDPPLAAARYASAVAALALRGSGPASVPTPSEVDALLQSE
jgi:sugar/nucleoside kinase (ribokinase family)